MPRFLRCESRPDAVAVYLELDRRSSLRVRVSVKRKSVNGTDFQHSIEVEGTDGLGDPCWVRMASPPPDLLAAALLLALDAQVDKRRPGE